MKLKLALLLGLTVVFIPQLSWAISTASCFSSPVNLIMGNTTTDSAHFIDFTSCTNLCGSSTHRSYIEFSDKDLIALALTADVKNQSMSVIVQTDATAKGVPEHETGITCKVLALWGF